MNLKIPKLISAFIVILFLFASNVFAAFYEKILVISIDALHSEAIKTESAPGIYRLMHQGASTLDGRSTDPPLTLISHTGMFTGLSPAESGKTDNQWNSGEPTIGKQTIFDSAKANGYRTGFFYSKEKLGYLVNGSVDDHRWSPENAVGLAQAFIEQPGRRFVFLHVSGLDQAGPKYGWLSPEYLEELSYIDEYLKPLVSFLEEKSDSLIIVTSDHAGHDKIHGSRHPEDYRLPFIIHSSDVKFKEMQNMKYVVTDLKHILDRIFAHRAE